MAQQAAMDGAPAAGGQPHRTKAETGFVAAFEKALEDLPSGGWVERVRREAIEAFTAFGLPSRRVEAFKYTDLKERVAEAYPAPGSPDSSVNAADLAKALGALAQLDAYRLVFIDGVFVKALSSTEGLGESAEFMPLAPLLAKAPGWLEGKFTADRLVAGEDAITRLNSAFMSDGLLIKIKPGLDADKPVLVVNARRAAVPASVAIRNVVAMEPGASMTLVEAHVALPGASRHGLSNALTDVVVADGARLDHIKLLRDATEAQHLGVWSVEVGSDATYRGFQLTAGTRLVRNQLAVRLGGAGSRLDLSGAFLGRGSDHVDTTLTVDHAEPGCESRELFKGVLDDRARGVFQGKIIVAPGAIKTDGKQMARALMLSDESEFDSKPELEIFADDVSCGHGATTAELDPDLMFYCTSRGIPEAEARVLLIEAFIGEAIDKVEHETVRSALYEEARSWFLAGAPQPAE